MWKRFSSILNIKLDSANVEEDGKNERAIRVNIVIVSSTVNQRDISSDQS